MVEPTREPGSDGQPGGPPVHPGVRTEKTDVSFRVVFGFIVGALFFAAWVHIILLVFFHVRARDEAEAKASPYPLTPPLASANKVANLPPEPRLEELNRLYNVEKSNVYERQESREHILDSYGPAQEEGYVHVPIDRAMKYLANKLPSRKPPADRHKQNGLVDGGESNSGRLFRKEPPWFER
jgi:hypothetical protein